MITQADLHCSRGPVSSMPGSSHLFPEGTKCDRHEDRLAVRRVQGETDSFGCEYLMACQECVDAFRNHVTVGSCDSCKAMDIVTSPRRDYDEGSSGRLYNLCQACRDRWNENDAKELKESTSEYDDFFNDGHDDY